MSFGFNFSAFRAAPAIQALPEMRRLRTLAVVLASLDNNVDEAIERNVRRAKTAEQLRFFAEGDHVAIIIWQRDCDCCEGTSKHLIRPTLKAFDELMERTYKGAEGPVRVMGIQRPSDAFAASHRDRVLEAYENGNSWSV